MGTVPVDPPWREWIIFVARWLMIGSFLFLAAQTRSDAAVSNDLRIALVVAGAANIIYVLIILTRVQAIQIPTLLLSDLVIVGALVWLNRTSFEQVTAVLIFAMLLTLLHPSFTYSALQVAGSITVSLVILIVLGAIRSPGDILVPTLITSDLSIVLAAALVMIGSYSLERQTLHQRQAFAALAAAKTQQLDDIHERTRAIYEMTMAFSETQHFEKILNAALDAGQLGLHGRMNRGLIAGVLLFQSDEPGLRVIAARRFARGDMSSLVPGKAGIIAEALQEGSPIIGGRAKEDAELMYLLGFQNTRSTLAIPLRAGYENFGVLVYGSETASAFTTEHAELLTAIGVQATIALQNYVLYQTLLEEKDRISRVAEDERKQLARQLHDGPTQKVSALAMMTNIIHKMLEKAPEQVPDELRKMEEIARDTTKEMRHMLFTLRPLVLESQGLAAALDQLAEKMRETHGQEVKVRMQSGIERFLDAQKQGVVFYLCEEAINNARKHARASLIRVDIRRANNDLVVQIADNGVGFDVDGVVNADYNRRGSLGMVNMRERAALLNGNLHLESSPGAGTTITVIAPLDIAKTGEHLRVDEDFADIPIDKLKVGVPRKRGHNP